MTRKTLHDLIEFRNNDVEFFNHCLDLCGDRLQFLKETFGFDFHTLYNTIPKSEEDMLKSFFPMYKEINSAVSIAISMLFEYFEGFIAQEKLYSQDPLKWTYENLSLEKRIKLEKLYKHGHIQRYSEGLIFKENLINYMEFYEPLREDYFNSSLIKEEEFETVARRFGWMAINKSLSNDSELHKELKEKNSFLKDFLVNLPIHIRINARLLRNNYSKEYQVVKYLYKRLEWALKDLCGHTFNLTMHDVMEKSFEIYLLKGEEEAEEYLMLHKIRPNFRKKWLAEFNNAYNDFTGRKLLIFSSDFERKIESELSKEGIFFLRHYPYSKIVETSKRYRMDFYVNDTIIEVFDDSDAFIHDMDYMERLEEKRELAKRAGKYFIVLRPCDDIKEIISILQKTSPEELLPHFPKIPDYSIKLNQEEKTLKENIVTGSNKNIPPGEKRMAHFYNNVYMKGRKRF